MTARGTRAGARRAPAAGARRAATTRGTRPPGRRRRRRTRAHPPRSRARRACRGRTRPRVGRGRGGGCRGRTCQGRQGRPDRAVARRTEPRTGGAMLGSSNDRPHESVARARPRLPGAVHGHPRRHDRERRAADDPAGPELLRDRPAVDRQRLHADVRRLPPPRRPRGRPDRAQARLPRRRRALHGCVRGCARSRRATRG